MQTESTLLIILTVGLIIMIAISIAVGTLIVLILGRLNRISKKTELGLAALTGWKTLRKWRKKT